MLVEISIWDIEYAKNILSKIKWKNINFDDERIIFIKNIEESFDLQAVPGSGKTTALLAKLLILEKKIDQLDWWILVLSFTNVAIDNIKEQIGQYCPKLFWWYPHFIWTLQSFVDEFLAKPYFVNQNGMKISTIDDDVFLKTIYSLYKNIEWIEIYNKKIGNTFHKLRKSNQWNLEDRIKESLKKVYLDESDNKIKIDNTNILAVNENMVKIWKERIFDKLNQLWILRYEDAFSLAKKYILEYPLISKILKRRFKYIFIDETQDIEKDKLDLVNDIFLNIGDNCVLQRIWDANQSIYNGESKIENSCRELKTGYKKISWSHRLHSKTTNVVNKFISDTSKDTEVIGNFRVENLDTLTPCIILYEDTEKENVIKWFISLINSLWIHKDNNVYKAIAWTTKEKDNGLCMKSYVPNFQKEVSINTIKKKNRWQKTLLGYLLNYDKETKSLVDIRKNILSSFVHLLRAEWISSIHDLWEDLKNDKYTKTEREDFLKNIYLWSKKIRESKWEKSSTINLKNEIKNYILVIVKPKYGLQILETDEYFSEMIGSGNLSNEIIPIYQNYVDWNNNIKIYLESIHWVKWEDHDATLVLCSMYNKNDIEYFKDIYWLRSNHLDLSNTAKKMFYVAFSRPKYLLCYAIPSWSLNEEEKRVLSIDWNIKKLSELDI